jgi:hypothetical protein
MTVASIHMQQDKFLHQEDGVARHQMKRDDVVYTVDSDINVHFAFLHGLIVQSVVVWHVTTPLVRFPFELTTRPPHVVLKPF